MLEGSAGEENDGVVNLEVHKPLGRSQLPFLSVTGSWAAAASSEVAAFCLELGPGFLMGSMRLPQLLCTLPLLGWPSSLSSGPQEVAV